MLDFHVAVQRSPGCAVVSVSGELDIATAPQLTEALAEAAAMAGERVVVNLLETSFIDSTGLTTLFRAHKDSNGNGFAIVCGPDNVEIRRVIDLMGFDEVFTIHESLMAAGCEDGAGPAA